MMVTSALTMCESLLAIILTSVLTLSGTVTLVIRMGISSECLSGE